MKRTALKISLIVVGAAICSMLVFDLAMPVHHAPIPTPAMPDPNAFDGYCRAYQGVLRDEKPIAIPASLVGSSYAAAARFRELARLLALDGSVKARQGDWMGAANAYIDAIKLGVDIPHGSNVIGQLIGAACEAIGRQGLRQIVPHLTYQQARAARIRLGLIESHRTPFADALREEEYEQQSQLLFYFAKPNWITAITSDQFNDSEIFLGHSSEVDRLMFMARLAITGKQRIYDEYTGYQDAVIKSIAGGYALRTSTAAIPADPITDVSIHTFRINTDKIRDSVEVKTVNGETQNEMLIVALAGQLSYIYSGSTYVLYSVGPDGEDNDGTPIAPTYHNIARVFASSIGDIVYGINP